ncbi:hypothetical protein Pma05_38070 [Plantactinospora mayteni]|uniref:Uncharacterized protein n=1 Tax=Plantactinospora mayteni TaxID=566021 RepID=A0ABQ4ERJ3_9ACTN|nr:hypothetical protein Pma05_38070 [Plantactinospora mayteni]
MRGRATPMIEVSMMTMNWAAAMSANAHQRRDDDNMTSPIPAEAFVPRPSGLVPQSQGLVIV